MSEIVKIVVDAMGGDNAPSVVLEGTEAALAEDPQLEIVLSGLPDVVEPFAAAHERCEAAPATEVIAMGEHPAKAVRTKKDSSIVVGCRLVHDGEAAGFFSAGSTGACLAAATLVVGRVKGIKRPAIAQILPSYNKPCILLDVGANADCKPEYLVQFAQMGSVYCNALLGVETPKIGLLNIGEEDSKGSAFALKAHELLAKDVSEFSGNCEPGELLQGEFDVVVTDGFTGNICLKSIEGSSKLLFRYLKDAFYSSAKAKLGAALVSGKLRGLKEKISPDAYGGSPLLGVKGTVIIGHGSSNAVAVKNGIHAAATAARSRVPELIEGACGHRHGFFSGSDGAGEEAERGE